MNFLMMIFNMEAQEQFKVGDIVHMVGTVAGIDDDYESYPILVKFDSARNYTSLAARPT